VHQTFASLYHLLPVATTTTRTSRPTTTMRTTMPRRRRKFRLSPSRTRHGIHIYHPVIMSPLVARAPTSSSTASSLDQAPVSLQQLFSRKREKKGMLLQTRAITNKRVRASTSSRIFSQAAEFLRLCSAKNPGRSGSPIPLLLTSHSRR